MKNQNRNNILLITLLFACSLFALFTVMVYSTSDLATSARAAALYEPETRTFIYEKNQNKRLSMASTTKIMTALVALENSQLSRTVKIDNRAVGVEGSSLYLKEGEELSMEDLLYALLLRSANDAALAIAYDISGSVENFARLMNEKAYELGAIDTNFKNPHGLDDAEHYTTAHDLALISAAALENPDFLRICSTYKRTVKNSEGLARLLVNHNKLLSLYDGAIGVKTGFTKQCGRCLVGAAERDGLRLISVTIDAPNDWCDHANMLDFGFERYESRLLASKNEFSYEISVLDSQEGARVRVSNPEALRRVMAKSASNITADVCLPRYASAPIREGEVLGTVNFLQDGEIIASLELKAERAVEKTKRKGIFDIFTKTKD
jgi:D-alanyl-D-alanine carboxypeptidase